MKSILNISKIAVINNVYGDKEKVPGKFFKRVSKGVKIRTTTKYGFEIPVLVEDSVFIKKTISKKFGATYYFEGKNSNYIELKYGMLDENPCTDFEPQKIYPAGTMIAETCFTQYMSDNSIGRNLYFEVKKLFSNVNPAYYFMTVGVWYAYSVELLNNNDVRGRLV